MILNSTTILLICIGKHFSIFRFGLVLGGRNRIYPIPIPCSKSIPEPIPKPIPEPIPESISEPIPIPEPILESIPETDSRPTIRAYSVVLLSSYLLSMRVALILVSVDLIPL